MLKAFSRWVLRQELAAIARATRDVNEANARLSLALCGARKEMDGLLSRVERMEQRRRPAERLAPDRQQAGTIVIGFGGNPKEPSAVRDTQTLRKDRCHES